MKGKNRARWECHACKKTAFGSESRAIETMQRIGAANTDKHIPVRAYPCPRGNGYHLTSKEEWSYS